MAVVLPQGTKEYVVVDVEDELNAIADLSGATTQFRVLKPDDSDMIAWTSTGVSITLMKVRCLIDTQTPSLWPQAEYRLYLRFTTAPELPWLGPFPFEVEAP